MNPCYKNTYPSQNMFTIKRLKHPKFHEWSNVKQNNVMKYYSVLNINQVLFSATIKINIENTESVT